MLGSISTKRPWSQNTRNKGRSFSCSYPVIVKAFEKTKKDMVKEVIEKLIYLILTHHVSQDGNGIGYGMGIL